MANHLAGESSPYLLQHKDNLVDWYPWGPEATQKARDEDKPIFLSIGYSACHWCHVMERESFTDPGTALLLNDHFVSIKVDREERPDLDEIYMQAVTALTGSGGWPLSAWLTPAGVPFYGGTYFPPSPRWGRPSFGQVLRSIADMWEHRRDEIEQAAATLHDHLRHEPAETPGTGRGRRVETAAAELAATIDPENGSWGDAPKFPPPLALEFLLAYDVPNRQPHIETAIELTLDAMAAGGIYDHLGGGFHRYSTDEAWLVPHFEKMLYDNAQLARCYLHAWQLLGKPAYRRVTEETLDYLLGSMRHPAGGFCSSEDADSDGEEGAYYVWRPAEIREALPAEDAELFLTAYGVTERGNFEGANILHLALPAAEDEPRLKSIRTRLLAARDRRNRPARDDKILAGWNGLALTAIAEAGAALGSQRYLEAATHAAEFIAAEMVDAEGRLLHSWKDGKASGDGFLDDYAHVAAGFLALYAATFSERWFSLSRGLLDMVLDHFSRPAGGFFDTSDEHETLILRPRSLQDSPAPSGNSQAATVLARMAAYTGEARYLEAGTRAVEAGPGLIERTPVMFGQWLTATLLLERGTREVAVVGELTGTEGAALLAEIRSALRPDLIVAARPAGRPTVVPLLEDREPATGLNAVAWVCRHATCMPPTGDPTELAALLQQ